jgi:hypothetical protein
MKLHNKKLYILYSLKKTYLNDQVEEDEMGRTHSLDERDDELIHGLGKTKYLKESDH